MQLNDEEKIVQSKSYENPYDYKQRKVWQARNQKVAIEGAVFGVWGPSPQSPEAIGGLGAKLPAAGGTGVWGRSPQRLKILHFFFRNNLVLGLY